MASDLDLPGDPGDDLPGMGGLDFGALLNTAQQMQEQMVQAQADAAATELIGSAGGGAVEIVATGAGEFKAVRIRPDVVDPDDVEMLTDLVLAALRDLSRQQGELQQGAMGGLGDLGGLDLGGLLGGGE